MNHRPDVKEAFGLNRDDVGFSIIVLGDVTDWQLVLVNRTKKEIYAGTVK